MYHKILLPTDGSKPAYEAAKHAIWAANSCDADMVVLNVVESKFPERISEDLRSDLKNMLMDEGKQALEDVSDLLNESPNEINSTFVVEEGSPATTILKTVEDKDIDLVVMGTSGKHGLDKLLLGSVAEKVVRNAKCAVTVVH